MNNSSILVFAPFVGGAALGIWALVLMYLERRDERRRGH